MVLVELVRLRRKKEGGRLRRESGRGGYVKMGKWRGIFVKLDKKYYLLKV